MKNKKLLLAVLSVCFLASTAFGVACQNGSGEDNTSSVSSETEMGVALNKKELILSVYDKAQLSATVYTDGGIVTWTSSNPSVATVDAEGNIKALAVGTAVITAKVDGSTAECKITVTESTTAPVIKLSSDEVYLNLGGSFASDVKAYWKGEEIEENVEVTVTAEAAKVFVQENVKLIGNESQTVGPEDAPLEVHQILLSADAILLEGIRLAEVSEGVYFLNAAPLNLSGADGAPCRAVLIDGI